MKKRLFIVHGWAGNPNESWFPWLKSELESRGFEVFVPALPDSATPRIQNWIPALAKAVGTPDAQTFFVGHSMGNQAIVRYLETLPKDVKIGGVVFVAGFLKSLSGLEPEEVETGDHWLKAPLGLNKVKSHFDKSVAIFSDDDAFVPIENREEFEKILGSKIVIENGKGHVNDESGVKELASILDAVLEIS